MGRAPCCDKANVKRGPWSPEEDLKLKSYIEKHGTGGNWIALPQKIGLKRCGKSCRLRWLNYLRPNIKHGGFTEDEDNLICSLYISIGSRWSIIAAQLPGRTDNDIKNYWNTRLKKKLLGSRQRTQTKTRGHNQIHQPPPLPLPPPLLPTGPSSTEHAVISSSNSFTNISSISPLLGQARLFYNHPQPNNTRENIIFNSNLCNAYDMSKNLLTCGTDFHGVSGLIRANDIQSFDNEIAGGIMCRVPQELDTSLSDMGNMINNCSTIGLGDNFIGSCITQPSAISSYEVICQRRMPQDWAFLDELRLLGYSE